MGCGHSAQARSGGAPGAGNLAAARGPPPPARVWVYGAKEVRGNGTFRLKTPARDTSNIIYRSKRGYSIAFRAKPTRKLATTRGHWVFGIGKSGPVTRHSKPAKFIALYLAPFDGPVPPVTGWEATDVAIAGGHLVVSCDKKKARRARALSFRHAYGLDRPARRKSTTRASEPRVPAPQHVQTPTSNPASPMHASRTRIKSVPRLPLSGLQRPRVGQTDAPAETGSPLASPLTARAQFVSSRMPARGQKQVQQQQQRRPAARGHQQRKKQRKENFDDTVIDTRASREIHQKARRDLEQRRRENVLFEMEQQQWVKQMR